MTRKKGARGGRGRGGTQKASAAAAATIETEGSPQVTPGPRKSPRRLKKTAEVKREEAEGSQIDKEQGEGDFEDQQCQLSAEKIGKRKEEGEASHKELKSLSEKDKEIEASIVETGGSPEVSPGPRKSRRLKKAAEVKTEEDRESEDDVTNVNQGDKKMKKKVKNASLKDNEVEKGEKNKTLEDNNSEEAMRSPNLEGNESENEVRSVHTEGIENEREEMIVIPEVAQKDAVVTVEGHGEGGDNSNRSGADSEGISPKETVVLPMDQTSSEVCDMNNLEIPEKSSKNLSDDDDENKEDEASDKEVKSLSEKDKESEDDVGSVNQEDKKKKKKVRNASLEDKESEKGAKSKTLEDNNSEEAMRSPNLEGSESEVRSVHMEGIENEREEMIVIPEVAQKDAVVTVEGHGEGGDNSNRSGADNEGFAPEEMVVLPMAQVSSEVHDMNDSEMPEKSSEKLIDDGTKTPTQILSSPIASFVGKRKSIKLTLTSRVSKRSKMEDEELVYVGTENVTERAPSPSCVIEIDSDSEPEDGVEEVDLSRVKFEKGDEEYEQEAKAEELVDGKAEGKSETGGEEMEGNQEQSKDDADENLYDFDSAVSEDTDDKQLEEEIFGQSGEDDNDDDDDNLCEHCNVGFANLQVSNFNIH